MALKIKPQAIPGVLRVLGCALVFGSLAYLAMAPIFGLILVFQWAAISLLIVAVALLLWAFNLFRPALPAEERSCSGCGANAMHYCRVKCIECGHEAPITIERLSLEVEAET